MNVLLVTFDSLRFDSVDSEIHKNLGLTSTVSPWLSSTAEFRSAFTVSPYTWGAFASLLASNYPGRITSRKGVLLPDVLTLPEILRRRGFSTAAFNSNPFISAGFGYARGFDVFEDGLLAKQAVRVPRSGYVYLAKLLRLIRRTPYMPAPGVTSLALNWIRKQVTVTNPFFAWVHYMDPHGPYQSKRGVAYINKVRAERLWRKAVVAPETITPGEKQELIDTYAEEIAYADQHMGVLLQGLKELGLADTTILIMCADHGDAFDEHGFYSHPRHLYEELIHIPLLIRHPALRERRVISIPVGLLDVAPTVLAMLDLSVAAADRVGQSLWPAMLTGDASYLRGRVVMDATPDRTQRIVGIRTQRWKLIVNQERKTTELFDLNADSGETNNVAAAHPQVVADLETQLWAELEWEVLPQGPAEGPEPEVDAEVVQRLRDLGYIE